jgi:hypothetical protein
MTQTENEANPVAEIVDSIYDSDFINQRQKVAHTLPFA